MLWAGEIGVLTQSRQVYYEQLKTLSDMLITADRDFYQAMMAVEEMNMANKRGDSSTANEKKADYEENSQQVFDGMGNVRTLMEGDSYLYNGYRIEGVEFSCQELIDQFFRRPEGKEPGEFLPVSLALQIVGANITQKLSSVLLGRSFKDMGFRFKKSNGIRGYIVVRRSIEEMRVRRQQLAGSDGADRANVF